MNRSMVFSLTVVLLLAAGTTAEARVSHGYSGVFSLDTVTAVDDQSSPPQATTITLIYPNPFNPRTTIEFELVEAGQVELAIFDMRGRLVQVVASGSRSVGRHQVTWDGRDDGGHAFSAGTYFCRLSTSQGSQTKKLTLAK